MCSDTSSLMPLDLYDGLLRKKRPKCVFDVDLPDVDLGVESPWFERATIQWIQS